MKHSFGSDNHSGVHPEIMEAIVKANSEFAVAYGDDEYSQKVLREVEVLLGGECEAMFVINGTGANILSLSNLAHSSDAVLCPATAHINCDECGAPDKIIGCKLIALEHKDGKVSPETVKKHLHGFGEQHHSQPNVLSISQPTELGTLYTAEEIKALADLMHENGGYLHIDGSRISNAAAALGIPVKAFTADAGADALSFGGTKNGLLMGEIVVLFKRAATNRALFLRKQMTQLYSKARFMAAQFERYFKDDMYLKMASHSNEMAKYLESKLMEIPDVKISRPVETNAVFAYTSKELYEKLSKKHMFYIWDEETMEVRWMCSFETKKENIDEFIEDIKNNL
jgi:threonine aldolase